LKALVKEQNMSSLVLEMQKVKADGAFQNFMYSCFVEDVCPWTEEDMEPIAKKAVNSLTDGEKRFMVKQVWGNNKGSMKGTMKDAMLTDEDLLGIHELLQWQYQMPLVGIAPPALVKLACVEGASTEIGSQSILELKELMKTKRVVCMPIHANLHWTVVRLTMKEIGSLEVERAEYYDWLEPMAGKNCSYAKKILRLCTLKPADASFVELPPKTNKYRQRPGSNDCGLVVWYALEDAMKQLRMEGSRKLMPQPDVWRQRLQTLELSLLKEQQKWKLEDDKVKSKLWKPKFEILLPGSKKVGDKYEAKCMLDLKWAEGKVKVKASEFFACSKCRWGTSGDGCDACNPEKAKKLQAQKQQEVQHLQQAVKAWYDMLAEKGIILEHVPEDEKYDPDKELSGGGTTCTIVCVGFPTPHVTKQKI